MEVPVFPLPDTVFFPGTYLPLHVFEPRYRRLLGAALEGDRMMGIALLKPGWQVDYYGSPPIYSVFGVGEIVDHTSYPDGTADVVLRGVARARLESYKQERPFRVAVAKTAAETHDEHEFEDPVAFLKAACAAGLPRGLAHCVANVLGLAPQPFGRVVDVVCSTLVPEPSQRQALLETLDAEERLWRLGAVVAGKPGAGPLESPVDPTFPEEGGGSLN